MISKAPPALLLGFLLFHYGLYATFPMVPQQGETHLAPNLVTALAVALPMLACQTTYARLLVMRRVPLIQLSMSEEPVQTSHGLLMLAQHSA